MAKTIKVVFPAKAYWLKVQESNRDMGTNLPDGDQKEKFNLHQGFYTGDFYITPETKKKMIADGIPNKGMAGQLFKEDNEGNLFYRARREHFNPVLKARGSEEPGLILGPPRVSKEDEDGAIVAWDFEEDGLIGNGSDVLVGVSVWDNKKVTLEAVKIIELVPYENNGNSGNSGEGWF